MKHRTLLTTATAASSATLLLLLSACGTDRQDSVATRDANTNGNGNGTQAPTTVRTPAKIKIANRAGSVATAAPEASGDTKVAAGSMLARPVTYRAGSALTDLTGARTSWFFPAGGAVVSDAQKATLIAAFGLTGAFTTLPADQGGSEQVGPTDGSGPVLNLANDAMRSWWYSGGPQTMPATPPCAATKDSSGQDVTSCPTPVPPANVPTKDAAEAKAKAFFVTLGLDPTQYQFDTYADEWNASVSATLLLGGMKTPVTMSVSFGAEGVVTYANGYLARPIQGDQYDLVGVTKAIARLNDQQRNWIGFGGGVMNKSGMATAGVSVGSGTAGSSGTAATTAAESGPAPTSTGGGSAPAEPVTTVPGPDTPPVLVDPMPMPCGLLTDTPLTTMDGPVAGPIAIDCPPANIEPLTVTLTGVHDDLTMVWDADGTVWLLPAYAFTDDQGGTYSVIGIDDAFIVLPTPEPVPMPEPVPVETAVAPAPDATTTPVTVDQASADKLVGLSEDAAIEQAKLNNWTPRVVSRDGESLPGTADYRLDRVNLTIVAGKVTAVTLG